MPLVDVDEAFSKKVKETAKNVIIVQQKKIID